MIMPIIPKKVTFGDLVIEPDKDALRIRELFRKK